MVRFSDLTINEQIKKQIEELGFTEPTEIQAKAIPLLTSSKKIDFHGQAQTGTGKTLAFGIPLLDRIDNSKKTPQALVVAPTRELAHQIYDSISSVGKKLPTTIAVIYGGVSIEEQIRKLKKGVQIIIGTPGRLNDLLRRKELSFKDLKTIVLDEADIMLDMGFKEEIDELLTHAPREREIWLFSATVKSGIFDIMNKHMEEPVSVRVSSKQVATQKTKQYYCIVPFKARLHAITRFIQAAPDFYGFIFCQTKILASEVSDQLTKRGYSVGALHGDMSQAQRNLVIKKFKQQEFTILVATDVAARGIDVANLTHVINYSLPEDLESYVHRVGRTGRAGKEGIAITFVSKSEQRQISRIEKRFGLEIVQTDVPSAKELISVRFSEIKQFIDAVNLQIQGERKAELEEIDKLLQQADVDKIRAVGRQLLFDKFIAPLDLTEIPQTSAGVEDQLQEIFINAGEEQGITKEAVYDYLMDSGEVKEEQIKTIRVIKQRTFVKLAADCSPNLVNALRNKTLMGIKVRVNMTCIVMDNDKPYGRRPSRDGGRRGGFGGGDRSRRRDGRGDSGGRRDGERSRSRSKRSY